MQMESATKSMALAVKRLRTLSNDAVDSRRLPGGIRFRLIGPRLMSTSPLSTPESLTHPSNSKEHDSADVSYIGLSSTPLSLREIFAPYFHLGARIRKHYLSPKVVLRLITGRFVPPFGRSEMYGLQYSMLPANRVRVSEVWKALTATHPVRSTTVQAWPSQNSRPRTWGYNSSAVGKRWK